MERYEKYKDSGVEWIGEIPEGWEVKKLARTVNKLTNGYVGPTRGIMQSEGVPYIQGIHIKKNTIRFTPVGNYYVSQEWSDAHEKSILKTNDLLVVQTGTIGDVGIVPDEFEDANCHALLILRVNKLIYKPKYFLFLFISSYGYASLQQIKTGEILFHINGSKLKGVDVLVPPIKEQTTIANYLDRKTAEIDELIAQKERLLELYEEEKTAIINQAVTKGIDPDVKLKDSGIDWLGEIPEGWEVKKLKYVVSNLISGPFGSSLKKEVYVNEGYKVYGQEQVIKNDMAYGTYYISEDKYNEMSRYEIMKYDILISCVGTFGRILLVPDEFQKGIINPRLIKLSPITDLIDPIFLTVLLKSPISYYQFDLLSRGGTMGVINLDLLKQLFFAIPPLSNQTAIVHHIETETARINAKIARTKKIIELQKEYRTALISEVVTGKLRIVNG